MKKLILAALVTLPAAASEPPASTLAVPTATGMSDTVSWSGTVPAGAFGVAGSCPGAGVVEDAHIVTISVPEGVYGSLRANFRFEANWSDAGQDLVLTVLAPDGSEVGSSDGGVPHEEVNASDLPAGDYRVLVCSFLATADTPYAGTLTVTTGAIQPPPPPLAPACGADPAPAPAATNSSNVGAPMAPDPDVPASKAPDATVTAFERERFVFTEAVRYRTMQVPALPGKGPKPGKGKGEDKAWDRVELVFDNVQPGDPFDRVFGVSVNGVELLRGTTPRTPFVITKDVTELASLFKPGSEVIVGLMDGTYLGEQQPTVRFAFYADEPTASAFRKAARVVPVLNFQTLNGHLCRLSASVDLGPKAPSDAQVDLFLSGHTSEEFWPTPGVNNNDEATPRVFHVLVDGIEVGKTVGMPYVYALAGFDGETGDLTHAPLWWTAQQAADRAGLHTGVGEIPAYRIEVPAALLSLLRGTRTVEIVQENGPDTAGIGRWITSARIVMDHEAVQAPAAVTLPRLR